MLAVGMCITGELGTHAIAVLRAVLSMRRRPYLDMGMIACACHLRWSHDDCNGPLVWVMLHGTLYVQTHNRSWTWVWFAA